MIRLISKLNTKTKVINMLHTYYQIMCVLLKQVMVYMREHFFGVRKGDILTLLLKIDEKVGNSSGSVNVSEINSCKIYITKVNNNRKVKYFLRKFKRLKESRRN